MLSAYYPLSRRSRPACPFLLYLESTEWAKNNPVIVPDRITREQKKLASWHTKWSTSSRRLVSSWHKCRRFYSSVDRETDRHREHREHTHRQSPLWAIFQLRNLPPTTVSIQNLPISYPNSLSTLRSRAIDFRATPHVVWLPHNFCEEPRTPGSNPPSYNAPFHHDSLKYRYLCVIFGSPLGTHKNSLTLPSTL